MRFNDTETPGRDSRRVTAAAAVLLALAVLLLFLSAAGNWARIPFRRRAVRFELDRGTDTAWSSAGNGMAAATTASIRLFSVRGKVVAQENVDFERPACAACSLLGAYYDVGQPGLYVLYPDGRSQRSDTEGPVRLVDVNESGLLAVLTDKEGYQGCVTVYDTDLTPLFRYDAGSALPLIARLDRDDRLCLVSADREGSTLRLWRIDREKTEAELLLPGEMAVDAAFLSDGTLALVTERALLLLDREGKPVSELDFDGKHLSAWCLRGDFAAVACADGRLGSQELTTVKSDGSVLGRLSAPLAIADMESQGDWLLVLYIGEESALFTSTLVEDICYQPADDVTRVFLGNDRRAIFCGESRAVTVPLE